MNSTGRFDESSDKPTHLSLSSGIGGMALAAEMAGFKTAGLCESDEYSAQILEKHWQDVPLWGDIQKLTGDDFYERTGLRTVDVISERVTCQSLQTLCEAGERGSEDEDSFLWREMQRIIHEIQPAWFVGETGAGAVTVAIDQVYADLENEGYAVQAFIIPAAGVDAPHKRDRVTIMGHTTGERFQIGAGKQMGESKYEQESERRGGVSGEDGVSRIQGSRGSVESGMAGVADGFSDWLDRGMSAPGYWIEDPAPKIPRVAYKLKRRTDRVKCLGNAVVPQQFYPIFLAVREEIEPE